VTHPETPFALAMREAGITQKRMTELCGVTRGTVWRWQHGKTPAPTYARNIVKLTQESKHAD
jgi:transcriptional regulator with XRE-family HTH domain